MGEKANTSSQKQKKVSTNKISPSKGNVKKQNVQNVDKSKNPTKTSSDASKIKVSTRGRKDSLSRMKNLYKKKIVTSLTKDFGYTSVMAVPYFEKIVINMGVGSGVSDKSVVDSAVLDLTILSGQKAMKMLARKSVSNFKLRQGVPIGAKVTLRGERMFDFLDKLISIALPRVRDFRGVRSSGFDGKGNFSFGISEQIVFPEINYDKIDKIRGMDVTIVTSAQTDVEAKSLLTYCGFPFRK